MSNVGEKFRSTASGTHRYLIYAPHTEMTPAERAFQMWAVHPLDLDGFGYSREQFYEAHILAACAQDKKVDETEN